MKGKKMRLSSSKPPLIIVRSAKKMCPADKPLTRNKRRLLRGVCVILGHSARHVEYIDNHDGWDGMMECQRCHELDPRDKNQTLTKGTTE